MILKNHFQSFRWLSKSLEQKIELSELGTTKGLQNVNLNQ